MQIYTEQAAKNQPKQDKSFSFFCSYFSTVYLLFKCRFCGLIKGISPKICILCVRVKISKRLFEPCGVWILF